MKILLPILYSLIISTSLFSQETELMQIERTLSYYLEGGTNNDFETLKQAFHNNATMKFIGDQYMEVNALEFFEKGIKPGPKQNRKTRVVSIDIAGNAASAQLEIEYPNFTFIDFMNLLKINGEWKIVSKIFYKRVVQKSSGSE